MKLSYFTKLKGNFQVNFGNGHYSKTTVLQYSGSSTAQPGTHLLK
jgi:hypothetical protein